MSLSSPWPHVKRLPRGVAYSRCFISFPFYSCLLLNLILVVFNFTSIFVFCPLLARCRVCKRKCGVINLCRNKVYFHVFFIILKVLANFGFELKITILNYIRSLSK